MTRKCFVTCLFSAYYVITSFHRSLKYFAGLLNILQPSTKVCKPLKYFAGQNISLDKIFCGLLPNFAGFYQTLKPFTKLHSLLFWKLVCLLGPQYWILAVTVCGRMREPASRQTDSVILTNDSYIIWLW